MHIELTGGQRHEMTQAKRLVDAVQVKTLLGDTGYDSNEFRQHLKAKKIVAVIPSHPQRKIKKRLPKSLYKHRYKVECFFHDLKRFRAVASRYDKSARNFLATVSIACIWLWIN